MSAQVIVTLNGDRRAVAPGTRLIDLLMESGVDVRRIAVERNRETVSRANHAEIVLADGDTYEVVQFVGGG